ncbi:MAG: hypothetical protein Q4E17_04750, partial [Synergistes sp.]|nr:hypothetical protein [Synergistes sp.]
FFYNFVTLGFDLDKLQFVRRLGEDTVYENNIAAGSFEPISGYSIPIEVIQEERMEQGTYLSEEADKILFGLDCPYTDKEGRTWLHQFVDVLARSRFYQESKIDFVSEEPWISRVIKEIALYSDIDFNAKDKNGRTAVDCLRDYDGKMLPNTAHIKELISAIAEERGKAR